jgi:hypothetical protein
MQKNVIEMVKEKQHQQKIEFLFLVITFATELSFCYST